MTKFARDMLGIADNFSRALAACPPAVREAADPQVKAVLEGVEATDRQLMATLERYGVKPIDTTDGKFDPNLHQAIAEVPGNGKPPGAIVDVVQTGYHDRRPAAASRHGDGGAARRSAEPPASIPRSDTKRRFMADLKIVVAGASGPHGPRPGARNRPGPGHHAVRRAGSGRPSRSGPGCRQLAGLQPNGIKLTADPLPLIADAQAIIDFTRPMVSVMLADLAAQARIVHVIGTTGFSADDESAHQGGGPPCRDRQVRQYEPGREFAGGAGRARRQGAARLRRRDPGNASQA